MSIPDCHTPLSEAAANWLLAVANPLGQNAQHAGLPPVSETAPILHAAELHGVLPAVLRALSRPGHGNAALLRSGSQEHDPRAESAIAAARLRRIYQAGHELQLRHHGARALDALHTAGVSAAIIKGPTFARRLYAEPAMRPFTDIDVLIPVQARGSASEILRSLGFELHTQDYRAGKDYCEDKWVLAEDAKVGIEVHSNLVHNPKLRRAASITLGDVIAAGDGDAEDATAILFVAAAHGAISHQFDRLQHLADVALAASGAAGDIDAERLSRAARGSAAVAAVHAALVVAGTAFGTEPCHRLAEALRPSRLCRLASGLVTPGTVLAARSRQRSGLSWRRKALRQVIRLGVG